MEFITIPTKKTSRADIVVPVEGYIKNTYGRGQVKACSKGLQRVQKLRDEVTQKFSDKQESTLRLIQDYHDYLLQLESRVPIVEQDVRVPFKWNDCFAKDSMFSRTSQKEYSAGFERSCMLFNLAALHSQIAEGQNFSCDSSLQQAASAFQKAAGIFELLKHSTAQFCAHTPTQDFSHDALEAFSAIMIAQSQESIYIKADRSEMSSKNVAKLASQTATFYSDANKAVTVGSLKGYLPREWSTILSNKATQYEFNAQYHAAHAASAEKKFGEQICRLQNLVSSLKSSRYSRDSKLKDIYEHAKADLAQATKDNEIIYHDIIPDFKRLPAIGGAIMAKRVVPTLPFGSQADIFSALVPIEVHNALQAADGIRNHMVALETNRLREATDFCNTAMTSMNLPGALQTSIQTKLSDALRQKLTSVKEAGGCAKLSEMVSNLSDAATLNHEIIQSTSQTLQEEEDADIKLCQQYGAKWSRVPSDRLNAAWKSDLKKYTILLGQTKETDEKIRNSFVEKKADFELLGKSETELLDLAQSNNMPSPSKSVQASPENQSKLLQLCGKIDSMKAEREDLMQQLLQIKLPDTMSEQFLAQQKSGESIQVNDLSTNAINQALEGVRMCIRESLEKQTDLLKQITDGYEQQFGSTKSDLNVSLLTRLPSVAEQYMYAKTDVSEGLKFYEDLRNLLLKLQSKISDFVFARKTEKQELMMDISKELSKSETATSPLVVPRQSKPERPPPPTANAPPPMPFPTMPTQPPYAPQGIAPMSGWGQYPPQPNYLQMMPQLPMYGSYYGAPSMYYGPPSMQPPNAPGSTGQ